MKDLVLKGFVKSYADSTGISNSEMPEVFESFAISVVLRKYHSCNEVDLNDFLTGGDRDGGIDGAAILVNGRPINSEEDLKFFSGKLRNLDFEFVFVQAKTSPKFDAGGIGTFMHGVQQFFSSEPTIRFNPQIEALRSLKDKVYDYSISMEQNPKCCAYYVTTGVWNTEPEPQSRLESGKRELEKANLFSTVKASALDAEILKKNFKELERGVSREIEFNKAAVFPTIDGVDEAYIGLLSATEFVKLISDEEKALNRDLFYDNVRDYQGKNPVNRDIATTLEGNHIDRFPLFNNGITIVARSISRTGDRFTISDFQIVNGCQTTHVLHQFKEKLSTDIFIPIKLVVTTNSEVITEVIKATNWQTAVMPEALESLSSFHKEIEDYYNAQEASRPRDDKIHYERRSKQYFFDPVSPANIVTLTAQTKSFVAMFLNEPQSNHRYYGEILKAYEHRLLFPTINQVHTLFLALRS